MMWNRKELKARGKAAFRANYWRSVLVAFLITVILASGAAAGKSGYDSGTPDTETTNLVERLNQLPPEEAKTVTAVIVGTLAVVMMIYAVIDILLLNPLEVGCRRFFLVNSAEPAKLGELSFGYKNRYLNIVKTILLRDIFLFLWSLLFVIPVFVKTYSYRMVPYLLAENPNLSAKEAITRSRQMMRGQKWNTFVLDLSFIGWDLLSTVTLGFVGLFYTAPYQCATNAELYKAIRGAD